MIAEITNLQMAVKDMIYIKENGILFILLCETSIFSKMDSLLSSLSGSKKDKKELGSLIAYKEDPKGSLVFHRLWKHGFDSEV